MADIDAGCEAIDRADNSYLVGYTDIIKTNPCNADGNFSTVKVYAHTDLTGLKVGTFYLVSGTNFKCRDSVTIGDVTAGAVRTFSKSLEARAGDYLGFFMTGGTMETGSDTGEGLWYKTGDYCDAGMEATYTLSGSSIKAISIWAEGDFATGEILVTASAATGVTDDAATLHGAATGLSAGEYAVTRGFEWDTDSGAPYSNDWHEDGEWDEDMTWSHEITGLDPGVPIYWRPYVITDTA